MPASTTPQQMGYFFPPEWHPHVATWMTVPHNEASWQGPKRAQMYPAYFELIKAISQAENVGLMLDNETLKNFVLENLDKIGVQMDRIETIVGPTNDAWCRDHGPAFLINPTEKKRLVINWGHNAWGGKYPPFDSDNEVPLRIAQHRQLPHVTPGIIMEGGSVEFNGAGSVLTSRSCLLNPNRNPHLDQGPIEAYLCQYYGVEQVLWVDEGIVGDDTDGHIDDTARFVAEDTVVAVVEQDPRDENYAVLQRNLAQLKAMRLRNGKPLNVVELPMPPALVIDNFRTPASYANFLICNAAVLVPTYRSATDQVALDILSSCFKDRPVVGLDAHDIIWGQGSFHCLTQQEPAI
jgi:agmatine deiminase